MNEGRKAYRLGDLTVTFDRVQCAPLGEACEAGDLERLLAEAAASDRAQGTGSSPLTTANLGLRQLILSDKKASMKFLNGPEPQETGVFCISSKTPFLSRAR
jgi:hypothetical protein